MNAMEARRRGLELLEYASRWWAGEVAHRFFAQPRTPEEHLRWLRLQACKELQPRPNGIIIRNIEKLQADYAALDKGVSRRRYLDTMQFVLEEFRHYVLFADVVDKITGGQMTPEELAGYDLPEERRLRDLRQNAFDQHGNLARSASSFCEGGGASIFFEGSKIGGDPISDQIAAACASVYEDETDHARHGVEDLIAIAKTDEDWETARELIEAISRQRLRMRNEQFGFPLSEDRINEIGQGQIKLPDRFQALLV